MLLTLSYGSITWLPGMLKMIPSPRLLRILQVLWLAATLGATLPLIQTGHLGGRLVHELGIHGAATPK